MQDSAQYPSLHGPGVFITGGATGIGAALVRAFNEQGARVTFADINQDAGSALVTELGGRPQFAHIDLTDTSALQMAIHQMNNRSPLAVLINNAATTCVIRQTTRVRNSGESAWRSTWTRHFSRHKPARP